MDGSDRPVADNDDDMQEIETPWIAHPGLLATVVGMGLLIVIGMAVVAYGLVYRMSGGEESVTEMAPMPSVAPYQHNLGLAGGPQDITSFAVGELLAVQGLNDRGAPVIVLIDPRSGREVGRLLAGRASGQP